MYGWTTFFFKTFGSSESAALKILGFLFMGGKKVDFSSVSESYGLMAGPISLITFLSPWILGKLDSLEEKSNFLLILGDPAFLGEAAFLGNLQSGISFETFLYLVFEWIMMRFV